MARIHRIFLSRGHLPAVALAIGLAALLLTVVSARAQKTDTKKKQTKANVVRTLDDINIEGEIAVPQVLFITSRDYPRYRDGLRLKFRKSSLDVARSIDLPTRLRVVQQSQQQ